MRANNLIKTCPFIGNLCLRENCAIFCQQSGQCAVEILAFKMCKTSDAFNSTTANYYDLDY